MSVIEYKVPSRKPRARKVTYQTRTGDLIRMQVGSTTIPFVLQHDSDGKPSALVHYASGYRMGSLADIRLEIACRLTLDHAERMSAEALAQLLIAKAVARHGVDHVRCLSSTQSRLDCPLMLSYNRPRKVIQMSSSVRTVLETRRYTNAYNVTRDYKLIHKTAGIEPAGAGTRPTKEAWGVLFEQHGSMHGRWFTSEADARNLLAAWAPNHG